MGGVIRQYSWIVDLVGILLCSFFLAKIAGVYLGKALEVKRSIAVFKTAEIAPSEHKQVDVSEYRIIIDRNIFDATERGVDIGQGTGLIQPEPVLTGEAVKTSLNITVIGVLVVGDGKDSRSSATIGGSGAIGGAKGKDSKGSGGGGVNAGVYSVGEEDSFAPNTKLVRVQPDRIEFINSGRLEFAEVASEIGDNIFAPPRETVAARETGAKPGPAENLPKKDQPGKVTVDQRELDDALQNLDRLYTEIRAVPNFAGGKVSGMKILSVKGGSLFAKLGLQRNDVLQKINGIELDVKRGFEIFSQLKDQKNITLDLVRNGQPTTLEYEIR